jgi:phage anti-repressor protein
MNELIKITENNGKKAVSARELYLGLGLAEQHWVRYYKKNITDNKFAIENEDYIQLPLMGRTQDFALSIDFAKKLSMMARTEAGENIRDYFVEVEKKAKENLKAIEPEEMLLQSVQLMIEQKKRIHAVEQRMDIMEAQTKTTPDYFTVVGYGTLNGIQVGLNLASTIGKKASKICKDNNYLTEKLPDPRFGYVKTYPLFVLEQVFKETVLNNIN